MKNNTYQGSIDALGKWSVLINRNNRGWEPFYTGSARPLAATILQEETTDHLAKEWRDSFYLDILAAKKTLTLSSDQICEWCGEKRAIRC